MQQTNVKTLPRTRREVKQQESQISQTLRAAAVAMYELGRLMDTLATANDGGADGDLMTSQDIQRALSVSPSTACAILRAYGTGDGKLARITRGRLMQLHRDGELRGVR